jgi:hypothetical protein
MIQIQHRRGLASEWTSINPILAEGELGVETDTLKVKLGDGTHDWTHLPYFTQGAVGPANSISIGTVETGSTSSATITGTAPVQTLNLVLEQGDAATITAGTTTTVLPGVAAEVTNSGDSKNAVFDFKIPRGTTTTIGTTTTGDVASVASVTNSGTPTDLVLDFTIPRGAGVPVGGTAGQILTKSSTTDFDVEWAENYADWTSQVKHTVSAGVVLTKGQAVYVTSANGTNMVVGLASNASEVASSKTMGVIAQNLAINGQGFVITEGLLAGLNTSSATAGDPIWLGVNGALIFGVANRPVAPAHMVFIGIVTRSHASQGEIWVKVQNGFELGELHDVLLTNPINGQALTYQDGKFINSTPASTLNDLSDVVISSPVAKQVLKYDGTNFVNAAASGGVTVQETTPADPSQGDGWFYSADGTLFVRYYDGTNYSWVQPNVPLSPQIEQRYYSPNYVINGAFDIWQRGTGATVNSGIYSNADRWISGSNSTAITRDTDVPAGISQYSLKIVATSANSIFQRIEASNATQLVGKTVTFSFYYKRTAGTGNCDVRFYYPSATDNFATVTQIGSTVVVSSSPSSSWTRYSVTAVMPSNISNGLQVLINNDGNTTSYIAGVQLEEGTTATAFRRNANSLAGELAACQRYYQSWGSNTLNERFGNSFNYSSVQARCAKSAIVPMRMTPTLEISSASHWGVEQAGGIINCTAISMDQPSPRNFGLNFNVGSGLTTGQGSQICANNTGARIAFNAEL